MRGPHNIWRLIRTGATFERSGAMKLALDAMNAPMSIRICARILGLPFRFLGYKGDPTQPPLLRALTALGPAYIKFGQLLSTRADIVGDQIAQELSILQDSLPSFQMEKAIQIIESELGQSLDTLFKELHEPVAAASLAQVHPAILHDGRKVAVKVLRPNIERAFMRDVDAFHLGAWLVDKLAPAAKRLKPRDVVEHFQGVVEAELDLRMEASVASEYAENTKSDQDFILPEVVWKHSSRRVLTTTWLEGVPLTRVDQFHQTDMNPNEFASLILNSFLQQALRDGLFHGDMHQGNLKYLDGGKLGALDFGIMGRIDRKTRRVYAQILYGFLNRDYQKVAQVHFDAGYVPHDQNKDDFAQALRSVGEPIFGQGADHISMAGLLSHLFEITEQFGMETRTELILLQRTMVVVEGVARSIAPELNIWEAARGTVESYIRGNLGLKAFKEDLEEIVSALITLGPYLPNFIEASKRKALQETKQPKRSLNSILIWVAVTFLGIIAWKI